MVTMAIMVIVTSIMLFNQAKFDSSTILRSLAYSVALSVRQAQVYGTSVLGTSTPQVACSGFYSAGECYVSAYGVYFNSASPGQYILFADLNNDGRYETGEAIKVFSLNTDYVVSDFCAAQSGSPVPSNPLAWCKSTGTITQLSIVFKRPNPDACFSTDLNSSACAPGSTPFYSSAMIYLTNQGDPSSVRSVMVTSTGLISAQ
jgi:hypothetical protein